MPSETIKYIVSFSSQDERHPVSNLLKSDGLKKWLSHPQEKSGQIEAVFQLDRPCIISYIDIGSVWCATVEVQVGCSQWPAGKEYETLVYTVNLMTPADCLYGKNPIKTQMFSADLFCPEIARLQWDRVKVICRQPYKKMTQFGLSFIRFKSSNVPVSSEPEVDSIQNTLSTSVKDIQKHFLKKLDNGKNNADDHLKSRLLKISASGEGGGSLSRTARLVLAASESKHHRSFSVPKPSTTRDRAALYSSMLEQKKAPKLEDEIAKFHGSLSLERQHLDTITMADVRHQFERKIKRKLTKEEKRVFIQMTQTFLEKMFCSQEIVPEGKENGSNTKIKLNQNPLEAIGKPDGAVQDVQRERTSSVKRKLEQDAVAPPAKKSSMLQKTVRQKMKTAEIEGKCAETKDIVTQLKVAKTSQDQGVSCTRNPSGTPFQYKGIRGGELEEFPNSRTPFKSNAVNNTINDMPYTSTPKPNGTPSISTPKPNGPSSPNTPKHNGTPSTNTSNPNGMPSTSTPKPNFPKVSSAKSMVPAASFTFDEGWLNASAGPAKSTLSPSCADISPITKPVKRCSSAAARPDFLELLSSSDDDDDDDIMMGLENAVSRSQKAKSGGSTRGRGRGRGRGNSYQGSKGTGVATPKTRGRGRGRGARGPEKAKPSDQEVVAGSYFHEVLPSPVGETSSTERFPKGFAKCHGCKEFYGQALLLAHQRKCPALKLISENKSQSVDTMAQVCSAGIDVFTSPVAMQQKDICSKEVRPTSFEKCEGCNDYYGANLMTIHQTKCARYQSLHGSKSGTKQPVTTTVMSSRGDPNLFSTRNDTCGVKSPPWLDAAEKRLQLQGKPVDTSSSHLQRDSQCGTGLNQSHSSKNLASNYSNSLQSTVQSQNQFVAVDISDESDDDDVVSSGSNPALRDDAMDAAVRGDIDLGSIEVECPLCGEYYPSCIIERHAATCGL
ncbi:uncharacterized protein LOC127842115 [Dreissena polymorpha]|uniref:DNA-repair protein Xrcc1 N-terminal domain-containing protein n=1 Tax=Dreissena polymorpha TaxID=45954 RepID=A0A9D4N1T8_DREPO|nr:uncharacterized protein LOC127842115 [Dreissena polymorpha]KAH3886268.1 hypothetical protein DPMN_010270 [Dreissena polymorpha]